MKLLEMIGAMFSADHTTPEQPKYFNKIGQPGIKKRKQNRKTQRKARRKNRN